MDVPRYITGISRADLAKMYAVANMQVGPGIKIQPSGENVKIYVDENQLKQWIRNFVDNGGLRCGLSDVNMIPLTRTS